MRVIGPFTLLAFLAALFFIVYAYNAAASYMMNIYSQISAVQAQNAMDSTLTKLSQSLQLALMLFAAAAVVTALLLGYKQVRTS
jgi:glucan phosphoethanolaminetransferase (alkaline phosphatase superfamily)